MSRPVNGLVCCVGDSSITVCNPATRQTVKLPDLTRNGRDMYARLGYDPVEDQYKVLYPTGAFSKESIIRKVEIKVDGEFRRIHGIGEKTCQMLCYPGYFENIRFL
ncbi:BnaC02g09800D [Brassica napus]|uniref:BnaC02g09800D protein n=1 Tax=Brassica napus TaxID=3708 RepID=A0A078HE47_BRANA|nr:BnaC02g09800D [Brassica napus]